MGKLVTPADVLVSAPAVVSGTAVNSVTATGNPVSDVATFTGSGDTSQVPRWTVLGNVTAAQGVASGRDLRADVVNYQVGDAFSFPGGLPVGWSLNVDGFTLDYDGVGALVTQAVTFVVQRASLTPDTVVRTVATIIVEAVRADAFGILKNDLFSSQVAPFAHVLTTLPVGANPPVVLTADDGSILIDATTADPGSYFAEYDLQESSIPAVNNPGRINIVVNSALGAAPLGIEHPAVTAAGFPNTFALGTFGEPNQINPQPYPFDYGQTKLSHDRDFFQNGTFAIESGWPAYYYDAADSAFQIGDWLTRTAYADGGEKDPAVWEEYGHTWAEGYIADYLEPINYGTAGYRVFGAGLAESYIRSGGTRVTQQQIINLRDGGAFRFLFEFTGAYLGTNADMSREVAYRCIMETSAERAGLPRRQQDWQGGDSDDILAWHLHFLEEHFFYWVNVSDSNPGTQRYAPFMAGINVRALTYLYEWEEANGRDPNDLWKKQAGNHWASIPEMLEDYFYWAWNTSVKALTVSPVNAGTPMKVDYPVVSFMDYNGFNGSDPDILPDTYECMYYEDRVSNPIYPALQTIQLAGAAWVGLQKFSGKTNTTVWTANDFINLADIGVEANFAISPKEDFRYGGKQTNQAYYGVFEYLKWRNAVSGRND